MVQYKKVLQKYCLVEQPVPEGKFVVVPKIADRLVVTVSLLAVVAGCGVTISFFEYKS